MDVGRGEPASGLQRAVGGRRGQGRHGAVGEETVSFPAVRERSKEGRLADCEGHEVGGGDKDGGKDKGGERRAG